MVRADIPITRHFWKSVQAGARMDFGVMFFSSADEAGAGGKYDLLLSAARFADTHGFSCVWTPERHFHAFGGLFPNPAVTGAAIAAVTSRTGIRAGSLISPLHHTIRIAEEWSVVDNLSGGRVAISFGSGWNVNDFLFYPGRYEQRQKVMYEQIEAVRRLWRGERLIETNSFGKPVEVLLYPKPVQRELPIWVTTSGNVETFKSAGTIGANLLTHLIGQDLTQLAAKIEQYRQAREDAGFARDEGIVSLMLHTFLGRNLEAVKAKVKRPFREYLRTALSLEQLAAIGGGAISGGHKVAAHDIPHDMIEDLLDITFNRYFTSGSLMGTVDSCEPTVNRLLEIGVSEIACLVDFGAGNTEEILESLEHVDRLRAAYADETLRRSSEEALKQFAQPLE
jgi:natural product biosynthesis luciferase-like monooxygenase protein